MNGTDVRTAYFRTGSYEPCAGTDVPRMVLRDVRGIVMVDLRDADVLDVENWNTDGGTAPGTWPCGVCHDPHPVATSWYVELETDQGCLRVVACEGCARLARQLITA